MVVLRHHVAVMDARAGQRQLVFFDSAGQPSTSRVADVPDVAALECDALPRIARELLGNHESPIDAFIFVTSTVTRPGCAAECIATLPFPVYLIPDIVVASEVVPGEWLKFQALDYCNRTWWLVEKKKDQLLTISSAPLPADRERFEAASACMSAFGFDAIAMFAGGEELSAQTWTPAALELSSSVLLRGAIRAVTRQRTMEGCHVSRDYDGRHTLTLTATKAVSYKVVHVERPVFSLGEPALADLAAARPVMLVVDRRVNDLYGPELDQYARAFLDCRAKVVFEAHDKRKTPVQVARLCRVASALGMPRNSMLVAIGGGVTLDVAGLAAALYCKGIGYLRIPTTLIGLVDAGIGVKQAVNFSRRKNLVGSFYPPTAVLNDRSFLQTLPRAQLACGFAEIIKIALIRDESLFGLLMAHGAQLFASKCSAPHGIALQVLARSSLLMMQELQPNLYETDTRRIVDFGHSFSPTLEVISDYRIAHGEAVALDMQLSTAIAVGRGICAREVLDALHSLLKVLQLPSGPPPASTDELLAALQCVQQRRGGCLNLVVPTDIGCGTFLQSVSRHEIEDSVNLICELSGESASEAHVDTVV